MFCDCCISWLHIDCENRGTGTLAALENGRYECTTEVSDGHHRKAASAQEESPWTKQAQEPVLIALQWLLIWAMM